MPATISGSQSGTVGLINALTAQNSTSGTSIDFTGIPSGVKRITVAMNQVSTNGTSLGLCQIGSGSFTTTGYVGSSTTFSSSGATVALSAGFNWCGDTVRIGDLRSGSFTITNLTGNTWVASGVLGVSTGITAITWFGGMVTLAGTLDRVRITTTNGTDVFDNGSINVLYE